MPITTHDWSTYNPKQEVALLRKLYKQAKGEVTVQLRLKHTTPELLLSWADVRTQILARRNDIRSISWLMADKFPQISRMVREVYLLEEDFVHFLNTESDYLPKMTKYVASRSFQGLDAKTRWYLRRELVEHMALRRGSKKADSLRALEVKLASIESHLSGGADDASLILEALHLRHRIARLRGYDSFYDMQNMQYHFQSQIKLGDMAKLEKLAKTISKAYSTIDWDLVDKLYLPTFPMSGVISAVKYVVQTVLGCTMVRTHMPMWQNEVLGFDIRDGDGRKRILILDLYARPGKRVSPWASALHRASTADIPAFVISLSVAKGKSLSVYELVELFHELGHVLSMICAPTDSYLASMSMLEADAIEVPARFFEQMVFTPEVIGIALGQSARAGRTRKAYLALLPHLHRTFRTYDRAHQIAIAYADCLIHHAPPKNEAHLHEVIARAHATVYGNHAQPQSFTRALALIFDGSHAGTFAGYISAEIVASAMYSTYKKLMVRNASKAQSHLYHMLARGAQIPMKENIAPFIGKSISMRAYLNDMRAAK